MKHPEENTPREGDEAAPSTAVGRTQRETFLLTCTGIACPYKL